jgi:ParB/RepB/Spo0J family partition protein
VHNFESPADSLSTPRVQKNKPFFDPLDPIDPLNNDAPLNNGAGAPPAREGLPPTYRMRADPHYVDLLAARTSVGRERMLSIHAIDAPPRLDASTLASLVDSVKRYGILQPILVQERSGTYRLIDGHKRLSAAAAAGLRDVPCLLYEVSDNDAALLAKAANATHAPAAADTRVGDAATLHAGSDLAQSLTTLGACADLLAGSPSDLSRVVVANLIRAEVWRASCLVHATRIARREVPVVRTATAVLGVLDRVEQAFLPERHVRALMLDTRSDIAHGTFIAADERILIPVLAGAVFATSAVLGQVRDAHITVTATSERDHHVTFAASQDMAAAPESWAARAFDAEWTDRPGGVPCTIAMLALHAAAQAHQGAAAVTTTNRGTRIALTLPTGF